MTCGGGTLVSIIYWLHSGTGSNIVLYNRNIMCIYEETSIDG